MAFDGPHLDDYQNVTSLNRAYLRILRSEGLSPSRLGGQSTTSELAAQLTDLTDNQLEKLAELPFLLVSFREHDDQYWDQVLGEGLKHDLFAAPANEELRNLLSAGLAFVWQLARQNPYALRLICGSSLYWCERIAEQTLVNLLDAVASRGGVPELRGQFNQDMWRKLLSAGVSGNKMVRHSAHMSALQTVLTRSEARRSAVWPRAARSISGPGFRVADGSDQ